MTKQLYLTESISPVYRIKYKWTGTVCDFIFDSIEDAAIYIFKIDPSILFNSHRISENFKNTNYNDEGILIGDYHGAYVIYDETLFRPVGVDVVMKAMNDYRYKSHHGNTNWDSIHVREGDLYRTSGNPAKIKETFFHYKDNTPSRWNLRSVDRYNATHLRFFRHLRTARTREQLSFLKYDEDLNGLQLLQDRLRLPPTSWDDIINKKAKSFKSWKTHSKRKHQWIPKS